MGRGLVPPLCPASPGREQPPAPGGGHPPFRSLTAEADCGEPQVLPAGGPTPSSGVSVPGPMGRWTGERAFWWKGAFFAKQGRSWSRWLLVCGGLGPGSGSTGGDATELPPSGTGDGGSARVPCQLPGRGGVGGPAPAAGFSGHR